MADWTRDQVILAFELYCRTPFGRMHKTNPEVVALAAQIGRTASAVAMKLSNLASLDPAERARGIRGLEGASSLDREIFSEFAQRIDALVLAAQWSATNLGIVAPPLPETSAAPDVDEVAAEFTGPSEAERMTRVRLAQGAFRRAVLASYESQCAICQIGIPAILSASHIIPWRHDASRRADPTNGLALCALHDRAFDRGFIGFSDESRVIVSPQIRVQEPVPMHRLALLDIEGQPLRTPRRFYPDPVALMFHRDNIFVSAA